MTQLIRIRFFDEVLHAVNQFIAFDRIIYMFNDFQTIALVQLFDG